jgi:hypothetical protein
VRGNGANRSGKRKREKGWLPPGKRDELILSSFKAKETLEVLIGIYPILADLNPGDLVKFGYSIHSKVGIFMGWFPVHPRKFNQTPVAHVFSQKLYSRSDTWSVNECPYEHLLLNQNEH